MLSNRYASLAEVHAAITDGLLVPTYAVPHVRSMYAEQQQSIRDVFCYRSCRTDSILLCFLVNAGWITIALVLVMFSRSLAQSVDTPSSQTCLTNLA